MDLNAYVARLEGKLAGAETRALLLEGALLAAEVGSGCVWGGVGGAAGRTGTTLFGCACRQMMCVCARVCMRACVLLLCHVPASTSMTMPLGHRKLLLPQPMLPRSPPPPSPDRMRRIRRRRSTTTSTWSPRAAEPRRALPRPCEA